MRRKLAAELAPGDRLVRRTENGSRVHLVEVVGTFTGEKNRAMVSVKAGASVFHLRTDEEVTYLEEGD